MSAIPASSSTRYWKSVFLVLEAVVLLLFISGEVADQILHLRLDVGPDVRVIYVGALLFLLIASPFFLRSLRWVALTGWLIAIGILTLSLLMPD
jgi:hypothetical protein